MTRRAAQELGWRVRTPESSRGWRSCGVCGAPAFCVRTRRECSRPRCGLWLAHQSHAEVRPERLRSSDQGVGSELQNLRALVLASASAYARRLRDEGLTPERMLVLVKVAADHPGARGFWARELTNDVVRWSIEAYFDE